MRGAEYIPVANIPIVDLGAQYEAAKARREESETRKLAYLNQFKQVRGALSDGLRPAVQQRWDVVDGLLDQGDMSFEGRKRLQQAYKDYSEYTAQGVDFTTALDEREAEVLSNPEKYNLAVLKEIDGYRSVKPDDAFLTNFTLPSLANYTKYQGKKMSSSAMAENIYNNLKAFDGLDVIRNTDGTLNEVAFNDAINAQYIGLNSEQLDAIYAEELYALGRLDGTLADSVEVIRSLSDADEKKYLASHAQKTGNRLRNSLSKNVFTKEEERAADIEDYQKKVDIQGKQSIKEMNLSNAAAATLQEKRLDAEQQKTPLKVNPYALFSDYVTQTITDDIVVSDKAEMVKNLTAVLPPGYTVTANTNPFKKPAIIIKGGSVDGVRVELYDAKRNPRPKGDVSKEIQRAMFAEIPAGTENPEEDKLLYLSRLINQGIISSAPTDRLGIMQNP
jgi:hypothetical protein